jgi:hypothetical protein
MSFVVPGTPAGGGETPEALFRDLTRAPDGPQHLWAHQADLLRAYERHANAPDLAVELPTGAGKTLVGMLIADWRRRRGERVAYLCPTRQLAKQAAADARRAGVAVVDLTGRHTSWNPADEMAYSRSNAVAVATYHAVFNSSSRLSDAHVLLLDDAHAAAGPVLDTWSVTLKSDSPAYAAVLEVCRDGLDPAVAERLLEGSQDPYEGRAAHLLDPRTVFGHLDAVRSALGEAVATTDERYAWSMIRDSLPACSIFVTRDELQVRPMLPPTASHAPFADPRQRIYLSATLGDGGEIERAFGRPGITRLPVPQGWDERGTGRRFFVFPELIAEFASTEDGPAGVDAFIRSLVAANTRTLLLAPSNAALEDRLGRYIPPGVGTIRAPAITESLRAFTEADHAVLALANRYDGIDLPDDACRLIVLDGLPVGADAHERFLAFTLGAKRVLQERMRTRLVQGAGRATRNANDWAVVVVVGRDLVAFTGMRDAQAATHPEVRAELEFGIDNSQGRSVDDVLANLAHFLPQPDATWRGVAEPAIAALRQRAPVAGRADSDALAGSARHEIRSVQAAWRGDWAAAVHAAERAIDALSGGAELRPYQALWNYVAGYWAQLAAEADPSYAAVGDRLTQAAQAAAARTTWIPRRRGPGNGAPAALETAEIDALAARQVLSFAQQAGSARSLDRLLAEVTNGLAARTANQYEQALVSLGKLLGAASTQPSGAARADALWRWDDELWIAWEAKSEQLPDHPVDANAIRQANTHLRAAAADFDMTIPPGSITLLVTPRTGLDPSVLPLREDHLNVINLEQVTELADDAVAAWATLKTRLLAAGDDDQEDVVVAVLSAMRASNVLPSGLLPRLTGRLL